MMRIPSFAVVAVVATLTTPLAAQEPVRQSLFYMTGSETAYESFRANVAQIDIVGPQVYSVAEDGVVWGAVDPRVLALARETGTKVMPLIHNPGFNQDMIHALLADSAARAHRGLNGRAGRAARVLGLAVRLREHPRQ